jgi:lysophospholipase L1-like esterase
MEHRVNSPFFSVTDLGRGLKIWRLAQLLTQEEIMKALLFGILSLALVVPSGLSAQPGNIPKDPSLVDVPDNPSLPRVLLIGDSIASSYTIPTRRLLQGRANVHMMIPVTGGYDTDGGLASLDVSLGKGKWDVIHFNWGLHDLTVLLGQGGLKNDGSYLVPLDRYQKNLEELVRRLKLTGATLIWATTTPVPQADVAILYRKNSDAIAYNGVARKIMEENGIAIDDLYAFALPRLKTIQKPNDVHFTDKGKEELAKQVAAGILAALKTRKRD